QGEHGEIAHRQARRLMVAAGAAFSVRLALDMNPARFRPWHCGFAANNARFFQLGGVKMMKFAASARPVQACVAGILGTSLIWMAPQVLAAESADDDLEELSEVQVTGTRIQSPNVTSANPITSDRKSTRLNSSHVKISY